MVSKLFKKYYDEKCTHSNFSMPKTITQIRRLNQRREKDSKPKAVILVPTPTHSVLKHLILSSQHPSKLKYFRC